MTIHYYQVDGSGFISNHAENFGAVPFFEDDPNWFQADEPTGFIKAKLTTPANPWHVTTNPWIEGATQEELDADLGAYQATKRSYVYDQCDLKLLSIHGSLQVLIEHIAKLREANTIDTSAGKEPKAARDETGTSDTPYIDAYVAEFGGTAADAAANVISAEWTDVQKGADIARYRKRAITDIDAATTKTAVDTAVSTFDTNLATI